MTAPTIKLGKIVSDRDLYQAERNLNLQHTVNDCFVTNQKVTVQGFKDYLFINKVSSYKIVDRTFNVMKFLGYITIEKGIVKASPLLNDAIVYYEEAIRDYSNKNCNFVSCFDVNCKFDEIIGFLKTIMEIVKEREK